MTKQTKICRVCGSEYDACNSVRTGNKVFNWREVACSPECGMVYLEKINASRTTTKHIDEHASKKPFRKKSIEKHDLEVELELESDDIPVEHIFTDTNNTESAE